jgi:hypothetical protein
MGRSSSKPTVLECMLKHFKKGSSRDYGMKMSPRRLCTLCELEWPTFGVIWSCEGTPHLPIVKAIYQVIIGTPRHLNQLLYINSWIQVSQTLLPWVQFCANKKGQSRVFVAQVMNTKGQKVTKTVLQQEPRK